MNNLEQATKTVTIANGESLSGAASFGNNRALVGVITPSTWTAAAITFKVSMDDSTYYPLMDAAGVEVIIPSASIATGASWAFALDPLDFIPWKYVKLQSGTNASAANQAGARSLIVVFRESN